MQPAKKRCVLWLAIFLATCIHRDDDGSVEGVQREAAGGHVGVPAPPQLSVLAGVVRLRVAVRGCLHLGPHGIRWIQGNVFSPLQQLAYIPRAARQRQGARRRRRVHAVGCPAQAGARGGGRARAQLGAFILDTVLTWTTTSACAAAAARSLPAAHGEPLARVLVRGLVSNAKDSSVATCSRWKWWGMPPRRRLSWRAACRWN